MPETILIVDDEQEIADLVELYLLNENYVVKKFYDAMEAMVYLRENEVDLAILDLMMPGIDGYELCREIRKCYTYPVLMLTARDAEVDKIKGFTLGADDYVVKPFLPLELVARVKAQLRRYKRYNSPGVSDDMILTRSGLVLNVRTHVATLNEKPLSLTPTEFAILRILCEHNGEVVSSEALFHKIWQDEYCTKANNTIPVHIRHLRVKMKDSPEEPKYIKTIWGVGYKIDK